MFTAKSDAPNAPHIKCSVVMPGQIGTSIRANKRKIHSGDRESDATDGASLAHARERFALVGRDVSQLSDDQLCNLVSELERRFRDEGLTSAPMFTTANGRPVMISTPPEAPAHTFTDKFIREAIERNDFYSATYKQTPLLSTARLRYLTKVLYSGGEDNRPFAVNTWPTTPSPTRTSASSANGMRMPSSGRIPDRTACAAVCQSRPRPRRSLRHHRRLLRPDGRLSG